MCKIFFWESAKNVFLRKVLSTTLFVRWVFVWRLTNCHTRTPAYSTYFSLRGHTSCISRNVREIFQSWCSNLNIQCVFWISFISIYTLSEYWCSYSNCCLLCALKQIISLSSCFENLMVRTGAFFFIFQIYFPIIS